MNLSSGWQLNIVEFSTFSLNIIILNKGDNKLASKHTLCFAEGLCWWPIQNHASTISILSNMSMYLTINFFVKLIIVNLGIKIIFQDITMN